MEKIFLYNTASKKKEEFRPIRDKQVGIYSCGPTVYSNQHIGNMYAYTIWDIFVRFLKYAGFNVTWVMNITDVGHLTSDEDRGEDKLEKGAKKEGLSPWDIAKKYEKQFINSLELLNINRPDYLPRATEHIKEQIDLARKIEERGFAYKTKTGLVFDTEKYTDYPKFANLKLEEMNVGSRVEVDEEKKQPWDFLLWVTNQPEHIMKWSSPWGEGFPGWHLECSAMSTKYLGQQFDIHTGGIEHIGVHHTNEIAQGYGAFGEKTANYWLHNAWLTLKDAKMSKSLGNVYTVEQLKEMGYEPLAFRYLVLSSHYRKGLVFSFESLEAAEVALNRLRNFVDSWRSEGGEVDENYKKEFLGVVGDDFAMPEGLAVVWKLIKDTKISNAKKRATLLDFDRVLGLGLGKIAKEEVPGEVLELLRKRDEARENKEWILADELRDEINKRGYLIEDSAEGSRVRRIK
ncbi:MAG: cysteine--tRNA ligase [Patescibacteria group bacterium]|jgi:cysteinyl-tRNA synthetase